MRFILIWGQFIKPSPSLTEGKIPQNGPKMAQKMGPNPGQDHLNRLKRAQNTSKWAENGLNGSIRAQMQAKTTQIRQKRAQNASKWAENGPNSGQDPQNRSKRAQNGPQPAKIQCNRPKKAKIQRKPSEKLAKIKRKSSENLAKIKRKPAVFVERLTFLLSYSG